MILFKCCTCVCIVGDEMRDERRVVRLEGIEKEGGKGEESDTDQNIEGDGLQDIGGRGR